MKTIFILFSISLNLVSSLEDPVLKKGVAVFIVVHCALQHRLRSWLTTVKVGLLIKISLGDIIITITSGHTRPQSRCSHHLLLNLLACTNFGTKHNSLRPCPSKKKKRKKIELWRYSKHVTIFADLSRRKSKLRSPLWRFVHFCDEICEIPY